MIFHGEDEMESAEKEITLTLEAYEGSELAKTLEGLFADLLKCPDIFRQFAIERLQILTELISLESNLTSGAATTLLLKPSQTLLDLCFAVRTCNLKFLSVKQSHSFSSVDSGLVELPILSTLEKPQTSKDETEE